MSYLDLTECCRDGEEAGAVALEGTVVFYDIACVRTSRAPASTHQCHSSRNNVGVGVVRRRAMVWSTAVKGVGRD